MTVSAGPPGPNPRGHTVMYAYAWYEMFGLMILAGVVIFLFVRSVDLALEWWLDRRRAKQDRELREMADATDPASEGLRAMAASMEDFRRKFFDRG